MARSAVILCASIAALLPSVAHGNSFLRATAADAQTVSAQVVEQTLMAELSLVGRDEHLLELQEQLRPMFAALPKNAEGRLDASVVRYALHRFFVQTRGWYVQGLQPSGESWNSTSPATMLKDRVPGFIQGLLEKRVAGHGLELEELAAFAATIQDLVHAEGMQNLMDVFGALRLPMQGEIDSRQLESAVEGYLMGYILGANMSGTSPAFVNKLRRDIQEVYPAWPDVTLWATDLRQTLDQMGRSRHNPFTAAALDFDGASEFVKEIGHRFGAFQDQECRSMKDLLLEMEHQGSGRVRLSEFYKGGLDGNWQFAESQDYLRAIGALDETDPRAPAVVIPNYVGSQSNCLASSSFYSVCCLDECEGLMGQLEKSIGAPTAEPEQIVALVSRMPSDTVDAPRNLSSSLMLRLGEIAQHHGGRVPLHGRLFAQWMHHAYPRECPFPHVAGSTNPMTPDEWMAKHGDAAATMEDMEKHVSMGKNFTFPSDEMEELPWSSLEELVAAPQVKPPGSGSLLGLLCKAVLLAAFAALTMPAAVGSYRKLAGLRDEDSKLPRYNV